jgi:hypothetical protein
MKYFTINLLLVTSISIALSSNVFNDKNNFLSYDNYVDLKVEVTDNKDTVQKSLKCDFANSILDDLLNDYSEKVILTSLLAMDEFHFLFLDTNNLSTVINYGYDLEYLSIQNQDALCFLKKYLDTTDNFRVLQSYNKIQSWCSLYQVIMFVFEQIRQAEYDDFNDFGEIMEKMDETRSILMSKYIKTEGQSYESLSISQQSIFIIDVITHISSLPPKQRVFFVKGFLNFFSKQ